MITSKVLQGSRVKGVERWVQMYMGLHAPRMLCRVLQFLGALLWTTVFLCWGK
jgi:hypothetical protein